MNDRTIILFKILNIQWIRQKKNGDMRSRENCSTTAIWNKEILSGVDNLHRKWPNGKREMFELSNTRDTKANN
jgi:hypothetical protein